MGVLEGKSERGRDVFLLLCLSVSFFFSFAPVKNTFFLNSFFGLFYLFVFFFLLRGDSAFFYF